MKGVNIYFCIDMQNDFIIGALGSDNCKACVQEVVKTVEKALAEKEDNLCVFTMDTHGDNYLETQEGKRLPVPHCIEGTEGFEIIPEIKNLIPVDYPYIIKKKSFGEHNLKQYVDTFCRNINAEPKEFILMGVCTGICVISTAILLKAAYPEVPVKVISAATGCIAEKTKATALDAMKLCQVEVI